MLRRTRSLALLTAALVASAVPAQAETLEIPGLPATASTTA